MEDLKVAKAAPAAKADADDPGWTPEQRVRAEAKRKLKVKREEGEGDKGGGD